ncbi:MAG: 4-aminobutyrate--2-oxoglutarate transaminase [Mesorhizobium sp.]|uniref:4-aminobutyrate--2-oxoglutarate transaminase n=1 Tax=unclassified Mesorhizobium TaxID=325217 RepID=UPI000FCB90AA|nr:MULTISPECIES: 4-aminobutyrate--2-oxoglutarate transaminase [unclassified Mesorhizobium]MCQ8876388.1 4-aminobutyrate--2-oxoglutarate transaminase [Mesorhizobium sp. LMG17149]MCT2580969.1 4-aminobutyrate--2-oxoglutarate transaminase [Mesorhizobium sp. P13.3]MDF3169735.1 4-aminobutyrate--2-oxoglutarate transaminase [Mesorhizobium sp. P16.1]MDF3180599.1 4-aminobutyrate--2-oxoglutarate transaminase [Mesorhizobium sp. P17.1]MDF3186648.1 4-aminobutyrate--2-oxoglutarate transaminase [Mesorhizobium 
MTSNIDLDERRKAAVSAGASCSFPIYVDRGRNAELWDIEGRRYIDFVGGMGALAVGHSHPDIVLAVQAQLNRFSHTFFGTAPYESYIALAERLNERCKVGGSAKTLLLTTGAEAVENAVKLARVYTKRRGIIVFGGAFHGRTLLTMAMTGKVNPYKQAFGPFPGSIYRAPFPNPYRGVSVEHCLSALETLFETEIEPSAVAALVIEPLLGEGGYIPAPLAFMEGIRRLCDRHGIVLVADEVQSGLGRTGRLFAIEHTGIEPDLILMAKSLAAGLPIAAVVGKAEIMDCVGVGGVGGTYAGNPLACAAALAVLDVLDRENLLVRAREIGARLTAGLQQIQKKRNRSVIGDIRGLGAMIGVELVEDEETRKPARSLTAKVIKEAANRGLLLSEAGRHFNVIRFLVPLTLSDAIIEEALNIIEASIDAVVGNDLAPDGPAVAQAS